MSREVDYYVTPEELQESELDGQSKYIKDIIGEVDLGAVDQQMFNEFQGCGIGFIEYDRVERFKKLICDKINDFFDDYDFEEEDEHYRRDLASLENDINYYIFVELYRLMIECKCKIASLHKGIEVWHSAGKTATVENATIGTGDIMALRYCDLPIGDSDKYRHPYGDVLSHSEIKAVTDGVHWIPTNNSIFYEEAMALKPGSDFKLTNADLSYLSSLRPFLKDDYIEANMPPCTGVRNAVDFGLPRYLNYLKCLETLFFEKQKYFRQTQSDVPSAEFAKLIGAIVNKRVRDGSNRRRRHR